MKQLTISKHAVYKKYGRECQICGSKKDISVHHIRPKAFGGNDKEENLMPMCGDCHDEIHRRINRMVSARLKPLKDDIFKRIFKNMRNEVPLVEDICRNGDDEHA